MKNMKTYTSIQIYCEGQLVLANPLENETDKAIMIESPNGKWVGKTSDSIWVPKSICTSISEKRNQIDSDCVEITRKIEIPMWFANKNKLI
jgi:hypothetical protein